MADGSRETPERRIMIIGSRQCGRTLAAQEAIKALECQGKNVKVVRGEDLKALPVISEPLPSLANPRSWLWEKMFGMRRQNGGR